MIKTLMRSIREFKKPAILTPLIVSIEVVLECIIPFIVSLLVTNIQNGCKLSVIAIYGVILIGMAGLSLTCGALAGRYCAIASCGFARNLRRDMFEKIQSFSFENVDNFQASSLVTRLTTDVTNVQHSFMMIIRTAIRSPFMLIFSFTMGFVMGGSIAFIFLLVIPILGFGLFFIARKAMPLFQKVFKKYDNLNNSIQENVKGMRTVKSFVREDYETEKFNTAAEDVCKDFTKAERLLAWNHPIMQFCLNSVMVFILSFGSYTVITTKGLQVNVGQMSALLTYGFQILMSLMMISMIYVMLTMSVKSAERICEVLNTTSNIKNPDNPVMDVQDGSIDFNGVSFKYGSSKMILEDIYREKEMYQVERNLDIKLRKQLDENQKEFLLREKIKLIKEELGDSSITENDIDDLKNRLTFLNASKKVKDKISREIKRYSMIPISSPEVSIERNYIECLLELPWNKYTVDNDDLDDVKNKLDSTHDGLEKVKMRIIEYLGVKKLTNSLKGPIICLVGPPGTGKTTLAFSIAKAMNRNFVKISVGGINDEAEIIGHRRTYLGASPGRIIAQMKKANSSNPVFLIDEIDKMNSGFKGDPASVLLEVLDQNQNKYFKDNYIEEEYDLSKVMFILTANYIEDIPEALKDRLEIIKLSGYTEYEKLSIARSYLIPKICKDHGINQFGLIINDNIILKIIRNYTKEAGVRELERKISTIVRKVVTTLSKSRISTNKFIITLKLLKEYSEDSLPIVDNDNRLIA